MQNVRIKNISKTYGEKQVLSKLSKEFPAGETTVIMGASGCGKTTLLRILLGLEMPDNGEVIGMPEKVSVLFQEDRLCEDVSTYENIALVLERKRTHAQKEAQKHRVEQEAAQVGITAEDLKQNVMELSGGMRRRIALLRALLYETDCVILDEPFKGLDAATKEIVMQYVKEKVAGRTTFLVTHEQAEADFFGGNIWKLPQENKNENDE
ncbi:ATP-binding cassette domain-containing protein [Wujia sp.]|uniref:ATP-binding cassette domain-containing protein n=1 Tax=Wujia sp. TaxID=2944172 RepID=UPI003F815903